MKVATRYAKLGLQGLFGSRIDDWAQQQAYYCGVNETWTGRKVASWPVSGTIDACDTKKTPSYAAATRIRTIVVRVP